MIPVKVKIKDVIPQESNGILTFIAEDTNCEIYNAKNICATYTPKTKNINPGDIVAFCNMLKTIVKRQVVGTDEDTGQLIICIEVANVYLAHKHPLDLVKLSDSKKSVIQAVKEYI